EAVLRMFDASVKAAPHGPRAAEAALAGGRAHAELWEVTRSRRDARSAIASLRKVDDDYPGPTGVQALASALRLAASANQPKERARRAGPIAGRHPRNSKPTPPPPPRPPPAGTPAAPAVPPPTPAMTPAAPAQALAEAGEDENEGEGQEESEAA